VRGIFYSTSTTALLCEGRVNLSGDISCMKSYETSYEEISLHFTLLHGGGDRWPDDEDERYERERERPHPTTSPLLST